MHLCSLFILDIGIAIKEGKFSLQGMQIFFAIFVRNILCCYVYLRASCRSYLVPLKIQPLFSLLLLLKLINGQSFVPLIIMLINGQSFDPLIMITSVYSFLN